MMPCELWEAQIKILYFGLEDWEAWVVTDDRQEHKVGSFTNYSDAAEQAEIMFAELVQGRAREDTP